MAQRPNPPKGMRDLQPAEVRLRRHLTDKILTAFERYGYEQVETPALEDLTRLIGSEGGDNEKLIFKTLRRGLDLSEGEHTETTLTDLGLRYDLTVPLARYYATNSANVLLPLKAIQVGPVWRAERPQKGRYRQFVQCDIDNIGDGSINAEAELLAGGVAALRAAGVDGFVIRINDRRLLTEIVRNAGFAEESWPQVLVEMDKFDKVGADGVEANLMPMDEAGAKTIGAFLKTEEFTFDGLRAELPNAASVIDDIEAIAVMANEASDVTIQFQIDPTLVRGQGYYTGTIFEVFHPASSGALGGGGRYDRMIGKLSGIDTPACGFSIGFERLFDIKSAEAQATGQRLVILHDGTQTADANNVAKPYRTSNTPVRVDTFAKNRAAQLSRLAESGYTDWIDLTSDSFEPRKFSK